MSTIFASASHVRVWDQVVHAQPQGLTGTHGETLLAGKVSAILWVAAALIQRKMFRPAAGAEHLAL